MREESLRCGSTFYSFSEVLRFFESQKRSHPRATKTLGLAEVRQFCTAHKPRDVDFGDALEVEPKDTAKDAGQNALQRLYWAARIGFRESARKLGLGTAHDFTVLFWRPAEPWSDGSRAKQAGPIRLGVLRPLGAQDILDEFVLVDPAHRARQRHLWELIESGRRLARDECLAEGRELLIQSVRDAAEGERDSTIVAIATREIQQIDEKLQEMRFAEWRLRAASLVAQAQRVHAAKLDSAEAEAADFKATVANLPEGERESWQPLIAEIERSVSERIHAKRENENREAIEQIKRWIEAGEFDRAETELRKLNVPRNSSTAVIRNELLALIERRRAEREFRTGLEQLVNEPDTAEARLISAANLDASYAPFVPPLIVASALFAIRSSHPQDSIESLDSYRRALHERVVRLMTSTHPGDETWKGIWDLVERFVANWVTAAQSKDPALAELVKTLETRAEQFRSAPETLDRTEKLIRLVGSIHPELSMRGSPVHDACIRIATQRDLATGERLRAEGKLEEARSQFTEAISRDPSALEAWRKLIDCMIDPLPAPEPWKLRWLNVIAAEIGDMQNGEREKLWNRAEVWIQERLDKLVPRPDPPGAGSDGAPAAS